MDSLRLDAALAARNQQLVIDSYELRIRLRSPLRIGRHLARILQHRMCHPEGAWPAHASGEGLDSLRLAKLAASSTSANQAFPLPSRMSSWEVLAEALDIAGGRRSVFGRNVVLTDSDAWRTDPFSGYRWPRRPSSLIDVVIPRHVADSLTVWELNRSHHVTKLAQAFILTGEPLFAEAFLREANDWESANRVGYGVNWISGMEVGLRAANFAWALMLFRRHVSWDSRCETPVLRLLKKHRDFLMDHIEYIGAFSNNHYLANIASLLVTSVALLPVVASESEISHSASQLVHCMQQQVDADGMHFENSLPYHCFVVEAFAYATLAVRSIGRDMPSGFLERLEQMFDLLGSVVYPDGSFPFVGDSDDGRFVVTESYFNRSATDAGPTLALRGAIYDSPSATAARGGLLPFRRSTQGRPDSPPSFPRSPTPSNPMPSVGYRSSGVYILRSERLTATATCMPTGVHGRGGHRHNDLLSFELAVDGVPAIIDPGTYCYSSNPKARMYFRSTKAHNTMTANGAEQCEITPAYNLLENRAFLKVHRWSSADHRDELDVSSFAFRRPPLGIAHRRRFTLEKAGNLLSISDYVEGLGLATLEWFFHFAPGAQLSFQDPRALHCTIGERRFEVSFRDEETAAELVVEVIDDWVSRAFFEATPAATLRLSAHDVKLPCRLLTQVRPL